MPCHRKGGRPRTNINLYKDDLRALFEEGLTFKQLKEWLYEEHQVKCVYGVIEDELKKGVIDRYRSIYSSRAIDFSRRIRRRGEYIVPGPNWVWSIDGHEKLKPYGIQIYACIDAYSRYIFGFWWILVSDLRHVIVRRRLGSSRLYTNQPVSTGEGITSCIA
ncbi:hypothetical protein GQ44DRAFT_759030 [Phaeosphaeriaceae sp. PMI808]|nr:hypothetical protein GQ44DRAFT_759030 [Phaeosphaeriaceae sp. PMI808]